MGNAVKKNTVNNYHLLKVAILKNFKIKYYFKILYMVIHPFNAFSQKLHCHWSPD